MRKERDTRSEEERKEAKKGWIQRVRKRKRERGETSKQITRPRKKKKEQINATKKET